MIQLDHINNKLNQVLENIDQIVIGKRQVSTLSLVALLAEGHILLEDVPGVGKTMLVKVLAKS
ncbi:MAG: AAA family ATPase, partial [Priestia megaterium]